jgi:protein-tyrosine phosphatase
MVCLGNICRSPLAEGILTHQVQQLGLDWMLDSAGTGNWHVGQLPDARTIKVAQKHGIDIRNQRARHFSVLDFERFDLIFAMDTDNFANLIKQAPTPEAAQKVRLLLDLTFPNENKSVPDPYFDDDGFEHVFQLIENALLSSTLLPRH